MANNHSGFFKCLFLILISVCVECYLPNSKANILNVDFSDFERMKNVIFLYSHHFRGNTSDVGHEKCISDLQLIGKGLLNSEEWAVKRKIISKIFEIENRC